MTALAIALVDLDGIVAKTLKDAWLGSHYVRSFRAKEALEQLSREPPDLVVVPLQLSKGSGFGLVNRMRRMEALGMAKLLLVAAESTQEALDHHRDGPTPAHAYVLAPDHGSATGFAERILETAAELFPGHLSGSAGAPIPVELGVGERSGGGSSAPDTLDEALAGIMERLGGYRVLRRLRDEDGGAVFACMDEELDRTVAVKIMPPSHNRDDDAVQRFLRERQVLAVLNSPHVLRVYGAGTHEDCPYLVRELLEGESLQDMMAKGPLDVDDALIWARETAVALKHAYDAGVVHRDVCPANIYIVRGHVKLARFNAGRFVSAREHQITLTGMRVSHQAYAAPERVMGASDVRSDIYSLGVTLHALIAGRPPFSSARPVDIVTGRLTEDPIPLVDAVEGVRKDVAALVAQMMSADLELRPQSWTDVLAVFDELRTAAPTGPTPITAELDDDDGPSGLHGTLRRMGVVELVQTLEMARKTATVRLVGMDESQGSLAFLNGQLVHASWRNQLGEDAFFALTCVTDGSFAVGFGDVTVEQNITRPTTGLLLEALRLRDEGDLGGGSAAEGEASFEGIPTLDATEPSAPLPSDDSWIDHPPGATVEGPANLDELDRTEIASGPPDDDKPEDGQVVDEPKAPTHWTQKRVHSYLGYAAIVAFAALGGWGGSQLPSFPPPPPPENLDMYDDLIDEQIETIDRLEAELAEAKPAFVAAAAEGQAAQKRRRAVAAVAKHLRDVLSADVDGKLLRIRAPEGASELVLELPSDAVFGPDGAVSVEGQALIGRASTALRALRDVTVHVEAHSDDRAPPPGTAHANNWSLTGAQAQVVLASFRKLGWKRNQVTYAARAEVAPLQSNSTRRGRTRNRRIDLVITPGANVLEGSLLAPGGAPKP